MTVHKLTAGDGYTYLTRSVAAYDATSRGFDSLGTYYSEKGEAPGVWMGSGLAAVPDFPLGEHVTEAQILALFGEGRHPNARDIEQAARAAGASEVDVDAASRLGAPYRIFEATQEFNRRSAGAYRDHNLDRGLAADSPVPDDERARIRSDIARCMFVESFGREPSDARELSGHLARISRQRTTAVAGYDLTFSPVKSVSTLWAIAPKQISAIIEQAHHDAVADTLVWLETHAAYTRVGKNGVAQVETRGLIAAAFTHRDSRAGDPDLHTHVAISNKVQTLSGRWLALDGRAIYKNNIPASEHYNTRIEALLRDRLGVQFADRPGDDPAKRPVREIVGIDGELPRHWSSRRVAIDARRAELSAQFQRDHGRAQTSTEAISLAQQANLETRQRKHEPRSHADQRATWRAEAIRILGGELRLARYLDAALHPHRGRRRQAPDPTTPTRAWAIATADTVIDIVSATRATWQVNHVRAEAERQARAAGIPFSHVDRAVEAVVAEALAPVRSVPLTNREDVTEPALLRRSDGTSVYTVAGSALYTSAEVLAAEESILVAASHHDGRTIPVGSVDVQVVEAAANGVTLNPGQVHLVRELATSGARVQLALAPAGTGKTTALRVLSRAWMASGGTVVGLAPSAAAATVLRDETGADTETVAKLVWHLHDDAAAPDWVRRIGPDTLVLIDEAGMASTKDLAAAIAHVTGHGGSVRLIGDDQQLAAIGAGGVLRDIAASHGAVALSQVMRFTDPETGEPNHAEGAASLALRDGDPTAIAYYLDRGRVHVGDMTTCSGDAYEAWTADRAHGRDSVMLAPTRELAGRLNVRARADRIAAGEVDPQRQLRLADGSHASAGDTIITRRNDRRIPITATDWVKNGDRWTIIDVLASGSLQVKHLRTRRQVTLPAGYVSEHAALGYAATVHAAQGVTADTCHTVVGGEESRQLLYVAMTRGRHGNHVYLAIAGDGDPHSVISRDALLPPTAGDVLARVLARDAAPVSATSEQRHLTDPATRLQAAADRYQHALATAAEDRLGADGLTRIDAAAERTIGGLTACEAYPTLRASLAVLALDGHDPGDVLIRAAAAGTTGGRGLSDARDVAAVLDWRLDQTGQRSAGAGPLPWLPGIPQSLAGDRDWASYLAQRRDLVMVLAAEVADTARRWTPITAPGWAQPLRGSGQSMDRDLIADLAVWRAATAVPDGDVRPTGAPLPANADRRAQRALDRRVSAVLVDPRAAINRWGRLADAIDVRLRTDPYWAVLASRLTAAERAGIDVSTLALDVAATGPLPDEQPAAALWWRLAARLSPAALARDSITNGVRPDWLPVLVDLLGEDAAARVVDDPAWPALVAAVTQAGGSGWTAEQVLDASHQLLIGGQPDDEPLRESELATALAWRITLLLVERGSTASCRVVTADAGSGSESSGVADSLPVTDEDWLAGLVEPDPFDEPAQREEHPAGLAAQTGRSSGAGSHDPLPGTGGVRRERLAELNELAADFYRDHYPDSWAAGYLRERLGTDLLGDARFRVGYSPDRWDSLTRHLHALGATDDELVAAGLAVRTDSGRLRDRFRDRVVFPITTETDDGQVEVRGFIARRNPSRADTDRCGPKYLNTAETDLFAKGHELFRLADSRDALAAGARPVLVEGPLDAIAVTLAGQGRFVGVAPLGTALTDVQADRLRPYRENPAGPVIVATDTDRAGQHAAYRAFWKLAVRNHDPAHVVLDTKDPAELLAAAGPQALLAALDDAGRLADHVVAVRAAPFADRVDTVEGRVFALRRAMEVVAALPPDQWPTYLSVLAMRYGVGPAAATHELLDAHTAWSADPIARARAFAAEKAWLPMPVTAPPDAPEVRWAALAERIAPGLVDDPHWPTLASHLTRAAEAGVIVESRLPVLAAGLPLGGEHPARDLDFRLVDAWSGCVAQPRVDQQGESRRQVDEAARARMTAGDRRPPGQPIPHRSPTDARHRQVHVQSPRSPQHVPEPQVQERPAPQR